MFGALLRRAKLATADGAVVAATAPDVRVDKIDRFVRSGLRFPRQHNPVRDYWSSLGLSHFPYTRPLDCCDESATATEVDPVEIAYKYVKANNIQFFNHIGDPVVCCTWDIDGLCATGKSSAVADIRKSNRSLHMIGQNLHLSSAIGYVFSSLKMMHSSPHTVWDRTAFNNVHPWFYAWLLIAHVHLNYTTLYSGVHENSHYRRAVPHSSDQDRYFDEVLSDAVLDVWRRHATAVHPNTRRVFGGLAKHILVVDSDEREATRRLRERGTGSDVERSYWPHYVRIQNYMYAQMALLDPTQYCVIDLNALNGDQDLMQAVVRKIISEHPPTQGEGIEFEPLSPATAKPYLARDMEEFERTRPLQNWQFTNETKEFIDDCTTPSSVIDYTDAIAGVADNTITGVADNTIAGVADNTITGMADNTIAGIAASTTPLTVQ